MNICEENMEYIDEHDDENWIKTSHISIESKNGLIKVIKRKNMPSQQLYYNPYVKLSGNFEINLLIQSDNGEYISFLLNDEPAYTDTAFGWRNISKWTSLRIKRIKNNVQIFYDNSMKPQSVKKISKDDLFFIFRFNGFNDENFLHIKEFWIKMDDKLVFTENYLNMDSENLIKLLNIIKKRQNTIEKNYEILSDNHTQLLDFVSSDIKLETIGALNYVQEFCQEILDFIVSVCNKHELKYWLDFGSLLGAIRHKNFIPWDDDLDIGMMRTDFNKLLQVLPKEIENKKLNQHFIIKIDVPIHYGEISRTFLQLLFVDKDKKALSWVDVFAYDYLGEYDGTIYKKYLNQREIFNQKILQGIPRQNIEKEMYNYLNLSYTYQEHVIHGPDGTTIAMKKSKVNILDSNNIFPLKKHVFSGKDYYIPNDYDYYLKSIYGDYMKPVFSNSHKQSDFIKKQENFDDYCEYYLEIIRKINEEFN
ncbi:MAG: LicD family protein [Methanosphaera sp.]|nr:LicD family protein [Methanosphaera sp.]